MIIATCSYGKFTPDMGVPVHVAAGTVPTGLPYSVYNFAAELGPDESMATLEYTDFRTAYLRKMYGFGILQATRILRGVLLTERADADTTPAVLLTHTDLTRPGAWCHRTMLAAWITEHHGGLAAELGGLPADDAYLPPAGLPGGLDQHGTPSMF